MVVGKGISIPATSKASLTRRVRSNFNVNIVRGVAPQPQGKIDRTLVQSADFDQGIRCFVDARVACDQIRKNGVCPRQICAVGDAEDKIKPAFIIHRVICKLARPRPARLAQSPADYPWLPIQW